jgi:nucleotide-binding universal stress UspA family protein
MRRGDAKFREPQGIRWRFVRHRGEPARGLDSVAERLRADCIVVGRAHDGTGALGSVARSLITLATRPVVFIP